ncbi:hypothetical protein MKX83_07460 [Cytobacillus sp. FSL M8-0252]|uniref:hypothetical protein n=1 Tax=Cytobacillus sp. FSL M8-0252 TaxID=2921621 RepID=UPI0030FC4EAD
MSENMNVAEVELQKKSIDAMVNRLQAIHWGKKVGQQNLESEEKVIEFMNDLNVNSYEIKWLLKEEVPETISRLTFEGSEIWESLKEIPEELSHKIKEDGHEKYLLDLGDRVPELVFHGAYSHLFQQFEDMKTLEYLVGLAMYVSVMSCTAELAEGKNIFLSIVNLIEAGHLPLGPEGNTFYLI